MNPATIFAFLKAILPSKKIGAWILGILGAALAMFLGVNNADLKAQFCASEEVKLPALQVVPVTPVPALVVPDAKAVKKQ